MKTKLLSLFLLFASVFTLVGCDKDEFETEGQLNARELQKFVDENWIVTASIFIGGKREVDSKPFDIQSPYIVINGGYHYNLARLEKFSYRMEDYREGKMSLYLR